MSPLRDQVVLVVTPVGIGYEVAVPALRALLVGGAKVALFVVAQPYDEDDNEPFDALKAEWPDTLVLIECAPDEEAARYLAEHATTIVDEVEQRLGEPSAVVFGPWCEVVDFEIGPAVLATVRDNQIDVVFLEGPEPADHTFRWVEVWRDLPAFSGMQIVTLRSPRKPRLGGSDPAAAADALIGAGWTPLTLDEVERVAAERRSSGADLLAGRRWKGVDSAPLTDARCAIADRAAIEAADRPVEFLTVYAEVDGFVVEVTPPDGPIEAVRVTFDSEVSGFPDAYEPLGGIDLASGRLVIGDPGLILENLNHVELDLASGRWTLDRLSSGGDLSTSALRLYRELVAE